MKGEVGRDELLKLPTINHALHEIRKKYVNLNSYLFDAALFSFFRDSDPDYDAIKWNMAQNYYVAKALGLDPNGRILSEELFGNTIFFLDTNVIPETCAKNTTKSA